MFIKPPKVYIFKAREEHAQILQRLELSSAGHIIKNQSQLSQPPASLLHCNWPHPQPDT